MAFTAQELLKLLGDQVEHLEQTNRDLDRQGKKFYDAYGTEHAAVARVRRLHFAYRGPSDFDSCAHCNAISGGREVPYPCDTIKALDGVEE